MNTTKPAKMIFFGTSDRSSPILESLKSNFDLVLCITKSDTKVGRKQIKKEAGVKTWSKQNGIPFIEIDSLKNEVEKVEDEIKKLEPSYGVVADFSFIIPKRIIDALDGKIINVHFSLLPKYRGASPVQFAILNGDDVTGITFYILDEKMDTGNIIGQIEYKMTHKETSGELYTTLFELAAEKLPEILQKFSRGEITPLPQNDNKATYTFSETNPKHTFIFKEDALIDWESTPEQIERMIRAFNPWPVAWSYLKDLEKAKCFNEIIKVKDHVDKGLKIKIYKATIEGRKFEVKEIQVEGKNKVTWKEFKNGYLDSDTVTG